MPELNLDQILKSKTAIRKVASIYFLIRDSEMVYVGQSENAVQRVGSHLAEGAKDFDSYSIHNYEGVSCQELNDLEADCIVKFSPIYNHTLPRNAKYKSAAQLKEMLGIGGWAFRRLVKENNIQRVTLDHYRVVDFKGIHSTNAA